MWYCIISILIVVVVFLLASKFTYDEDLIFGITTITIIFLFFIPMINYAIGRYTVDEEHKLYNITGLELQNQENSSFYGSFVLGCGTVAGQTSQQLQYVFFSNEEYGKQLQTLPFNGTYLKETDDETPQVIELRTVIKKKVTIIDELWGKNKDYEVGLEKTKHILVVPTNTIKIDYNVEI